MILFVFIAVCLLSVRLANRYKENLFDTIAFSTAILILTLYILAFFKGMKLISILCAVYILIETANAIRKKAFGEIAKTLNDPVFFAFIAVCIIVTFLTSNQMFTWWDDINFWSSDARQMFFMNGFAGKYGNVSPEFGDYPPVPTIFKWILLQLSPNNYNESFQFAGYFILNTIFLLPLAACIDKVKLFDKKLLDCAMKVAFFLAVLMLPGVFNGIIFYGTPSDITMGIIYGALLLAIWQQQGHDPVFYYARIGVYTALLLLTKSVGIEWALFALIFYFVFAKKQKGILASIAVSGSFYISWLLFCLVNRRVAKLTGAGIKMAAGDYSVPDNAVDKMGYFFSGFAKIPMHVDKNITFDPSTLAAVIILFAVLIIIGYKKLLDHKELKKMVIFLIATALVTYGVIFLAHISIFQTEDQYLDAYAMAVSIARYGCPYTLGSMMLLIEILFDRQKSKEYLKTGTYTAIIVILCILLTADYSGWYGYLYGYRADLDENRAVIDDMVGDDGRMILDAVSSSDYWGKRVLVIRDGHEFHWVHDAYISRQASPVAMVYGGFLIEDDTPETISERLDMSHAMYLYVEDDEGIADELFKPLMKDGEVYRSATVYRISKDGNDIKLSVE